MNTKKFICLLLSIIVLSFAGCCFVTRPPYQEKNSTEFESWLSGVHSNEAVYIFLLNCKYVKDDDPSEWKKPSLDYQQTPNEFFHNMKGDCEDWHLFISYVYVRTGLAKRTYVVRSYFTYPEYGYHVYSVLEIIDGEYIAVNYYDWYKPVKYIKDTIKVIPGGKWIDKIWEIKEKSK